MSKRPTRRRGYALMLVVLFVVLFGAMLGIALRRVASAIRIEHVCDVRKRCDKGSIQALAQAMKMLEARLRKSGAGAAEVDVSATTTPDYRTVALGQPFQFQTSYPLPNDAVTQRYKVDIAPVAVDGTAWSVNVTVADQNENLDGRLPMPGSPP